MNVSVFKNWKLSRVAIAGAIFAFAFVMAVRGPAVNVRVTRWEIVGENCLATVSLENRTSRPTTKLVEVTAHRVSSAGKSARTTTTLASCETNVVLQPHETREITACIPQSGWHVSLVHARFK